MLFRDISSSSVAKTRPPPKLSSCIGTVHSYFLGTRFAFDFRVFHYFLKGFVLVISEHYLASGPNASATIPKWFDDYVPIVFFIADILPE